MRVVSKGHSAIGCLLHTTQDLTITLSLSVCVIECAVDLLFLQ